MTESTKWPKPEGLQIDLLHDAAWDIRDYGIAQIPTTENPEQILHWLCRHQGFSTEEIAVLHTLNSVFYIGYKD